MALACRALCAHSEGVDHVKSRNDNVEASQRKSFYGSRQCLCARRLPSLVISWLGARTGTARAWPKRDTCARHAPVSSGERSEERRRRRRSQARAMKVGLTSGLARRTEQCRDGKGLAWSPRAECVMVHRECRREPAGQSGPHVSSKKLGRTSRSERPLVYVAGASDSLCCLSEDRSFLQAAPRTAQMSGTKRLVHRW